jgi:hypothetical protein
VLAAQFQSVSFLGKTEYPLISGIWDEIGTDDDWFALNSFCFGCHVFSNVEDLDCLIYFLIQTKGM